MKRFTRTINGAQARSPYEELTEYKPRAIRLIIQIYTCRQCVKPHRVPAASPMLHIISENGRRRKHFALDKWPFATPDGLPHETVEVFSTVEHCEECFAKLDPRQAEMFPSRIIRNIPRQFLPEITLPEAPSPTEAPTEAPTIRLEDLFAKPTGAS